MATAVTIEGTPEVVVSHWEPAIAASVDGCQARGHGPPLAAELAARLYSPPVRVSRAVPGWSVVETWVVWPDMVATVAPLADVIVLTKLPIGAIESTRLEHGQRYLGLDAVLAIKPCARSIGAPDGEFDVLYLAGFDGETMRRLATAATDQPPLPFRPRTSTGS
ncbi:MAG: hypothetical protein IT379_02170 [Deltaproteobacteria bacterium]|nr:hypothetical protein [Deltaproteobacteria bacterium]